MQLVSLGCVFCVMGFISLGSLLSNFFVYQRIHTEHTEWINTTWTDVLLHGLTIGASTGEEGPSAPWPDLFARPLCSTSLPDLFA